VYIVVVGGLLLTALLIWVEGFLALDPPQPPDEPGSPYPMASAIIAAYLPNEAATIVETVEAFLRVDYPGPLQIILAYNTPQPMPVEAVFTEIARRDPRFVPYRVEASTSKAQNVNAALGLVNGEFAGVFDADHHPDPDAFSRAWRWLSNGYDVVQGHCVVRNGHSSWVARTVAVEFESIYAVSHPGRARLHGFGIFGGSNGYWRTGLLRMVRMHGFMLTEDIDSSLRVVESGGKIAVDPALVSRELAPTALKALWNQRMRWAQGWFQVSLKHLVRGWRSPALTVRQKLGFTFLLGWREFYPWLSLQVFPLIAYFALKASSLAALNWFIPIFVLTTLFTLSVGPGQTYFAWRLAVPELRRHGRWFWTYLVVSSLFYTEMKNIIARVAQVKEAMGDRQWTVTSRAGTGPAESQPAESQPAEGQKAP
jgi:cellulose synthase/poly-beta-1,6-N-acetylglucosamine synthase-like glycosyltransferase